MPYVLFDLSSHEVHHDEVEDHVCEDEVGKGAFLCDVREELFVLRIYLDAEIG